MFEDSLVESVGRIRTRSRYFAIGSFAVQASLLTALMLYPFLHPATLPKQALATLLTAPPLPSSPANLPQRAVPASMHVQPMDLNDLFTAPSRIHQSLSMTPDSESAPAGVDSGLGKTGSGSNSDLFGALAYPHLHY